MVESEEAYFGISLWSPFLLEECQGNLLSSDNIPLDQSFSYEAFSHIQSIQARADPILPKT